MKKLLCWQSKRGLLIFEDYTTMLYEMHQIKSNCLPTKVYGYILLTLFMEVKSSFHTTDCTAPCLANIFLLCPAESTPARSCTFCAWLSCRTLSQLVSFSAALSSDAGPYIVTSIKHLATHIMASTGNALLLDVK